MKKSIGPEWRRRAGGYAMLLMLLVVIVIMAMLYYIDLSALFPTSPVRPEPKVTGYQPWSEEWRLADSNLPRPKQKRPSAAVLAAKPTIPNELRLKAEVNRGENPRGHIILTVSPAGKILGRWLCRYSYPDTRYTIEAEFVGNTDPAKTFEKDDKQDPAKLFMIAKGTCTQTAVKIQNGRTSTSTAMIYFVGWLQPDHAAFGTLHTTTDKVTQVIYEWSGTAVAHRQK